MSRDPGNPNSYGNYGGASYPNTHMGSGSKKDQKSVPNENSQMRKDIINAKLVSQAKQRTATADKGGSSGGGSGMDQLQQMMGGGGGGSSVNMKGLESQAKNAVAVEYDAKIAALVDAMNRAKTRGANAKKDVAGVYSGVSKYYDAQQKPTQAMFKTAKSEASNRAKSQKSEIAADYTNRLKEQVDMYKQLGIEAAAPSTLSGQGADEAAAMAQADQTAATENSALNQEQVADTGYWRESGGAVRQEGAEANTTLTRQLQDYLNQQDSQVAALKGAKSSAYAAALSQLQQAAAASQAKAQDTQFNQMLALAKLKLQMANSSGGGSGGSGSSKVGSGLTGAAQMLGGTGGLYDAFQQQLQNATTWRNTPQAARYYGGHAPTSPEEMAKVIKEGAANNGMSPADQLRLYNAALAYYGRGS